MKAYSTSEWSLRLPPGWEALAKDGCRSIFKPNGAGALQISAAVKDGTVTHEDLVEFASLPQVSGAAEVHVGGFVGLEEDDCQEATFWRRWWLRNGRVALFVTYNCAVDDRHEERVAVDQILRSLSAP